MMTKAGPRQATGKNGRRVRMLLLAGTMLMFGGMPSAYAQATAASPAAMRQISVPAGPLTAALNQLASQTGLQILFDARLANGKTSRGANGRLTASEALTAVLAGTGLSGRFTGANSATVVDPTANAGLSANGAVQLGTIEVEGDATQGYVATATSTGTKTDTPLREVPQTVNVITRQELDDRGVTDLNAAAAYTPGIRVIDYPGGQGMPDIYLRGFRAISQDSAYRDGLRNGFNAYDTDLEIYGLERLDILKGPASVLYGQGTPGGLVDMTSKRPTATPLREIQIQGGSFDRKQAAFDLSGPATKDGTILYRLTGLLRESGTQIDHSPDDRIYIAPAVTWKPTDATSITLLASYQKSKKGGAEQSLPMDNTIFNNGPRISSSLYLGIPGLSEWKTENTSIGYEFKHRFDSGWKFNQNFRYTHSKIDYVSAWIWNWPVALANDHFANIGAQSRPKTSNSVLLDNNITGTFTTGALTHNVVAGIDYGHYDYKETRTNSSNFITIDIYNPVYNGSTLTWGTPWVDEKGKLNQVGLYGQDQIKLDNWILSVAGRQDWVEATTEDYLAATTTKTRDSAFTGRVGLGYLFANGLTPYVSYATSFQPTSGTDFYGAQLKPTTGEQWEGGVKYQPLGWNAFITASVFDITQQNVTTADPTHVGFSNQEGEVRSRGFEVEGKATLSEAVGVIAGYSYTDARITKDNPNTSGISKVGTRMTSVPYHQASLWMDYKFQEPVLRGFKAGAGVRYMGGSMAAIDTTTGTQIEVGGYGLFDASVSYDFGARSPQLKGLSLTVTGTNLADKQYFTPGFYSNTVFYGNRRAVVATLAYKW